METINLTKGSQFRENLDAIQIQMNRLEFLLFISMKIELNESGFLVLSYETKRLKENCFWEDCTNGVYEKTYSHKQRGINILIEDSLKALNQRSKLDELFSGIWEIEIHSDFSAVLLLALERLVLMIDKSLYGKEKAILNWNAFERINNENFEELVSEGLLIRVEE
jgi:hypothetical protein